MTPIRSHFAATGLMVGALLLTGCGQFSFPGVLSAAPKPQQKQTTSVVAGRRFGDPIAKFAISNRPNHRANLKLKDGRLVTIWVGSDYMAATRDRCRRIVFQVAAAQREVSAVCLQNNVWRTIIEPK